MQRLVEFFSFCSAHFVPEPGCRACRGGTYHVVGWGWETLRARLFGSTSITGEQS